MQQVNNSEQTKKVPIVLRCIHKYISKELDLENRIDRNRLWSILGVSYHIPREDKPRVIEEMMEAGIILKCDRYYYTIADF